MFYPVSNPNFKSSYIYIYIHIDLDIVIGYHIDTVLKKRYIIISLKS